MSTDLQLWAVRGHASFQTVAWARTAEDAVSAVGEREYESNWDKSARAIPIERAVLITGDLHDMAQDDELWYYWGDDPVDPPTLAAVLEILRDRHAAAKRAAAERDNGQIPLWAKAIVPDDALPRDSLVTDMMTGKIKPCALVPATEALSITPTDELR